MTKIDIFSGFLGAGKTTLIKKLIAEAYAGEKLVLIENEFGEIGIDGGFLKESGVNVTEMNSGCICCSLVGDFAKALSQVIEKFTPDRIIIEPSGVGKLSDVIKAVKDLDNNEIILNSAVTVADAKKCKMYIKNFGEFYNNQLEHAETIVLSRTDSLDEEKLASVIELIRTVNSEAQIITTVWDEITGNQILSVMEKENSLKKELEHIHHEHHHHDEHCECEHHHHDHDEHCHCGEHHHEHHHHEHHHEHGEHCECGCHEHHHEHHHHADEVFESVGFETASKYTQSQVAEILNELNNTEKYGVILRAKGYVANSRERNWIFFDFVPEESDLRFGSPEVIGRICVIGSNINKKALEELFNIK